jgi:hypothetical protein
MCKGRRAGEDARGPRASANLDAPLPYDRSAHPDRDGVAAGGGVGDVILEQRKVRVHVVHELSSARAVVVLGAELGADTSVQTFTERLRQYPQTVSQLLEENPFNPPLSYLEWAAKQ